MLFCRQPSVSTGDMKKCIGRKRRVAGQLKMAAKQDRKSLPPVPQEVDGTNDKQSGVQQTNVSVEQTRSSCIKRPSTSGVSSMGELEDVDVDDEIYSEIHLPSPSRSGTTVVKRMPADLQHLYEMADNLQLPGSVPQSPDNSSDSMHNRSPVEMLQKDANCCKQDMVPEQSSQQSEHISRNPGIIINDKKAKVQSSEPRWDWPGLATVAGETSNYSYSSHLGSQGYNQNISHVHSKQSYKPKSSPPYDYADTFF